MISKIKRKFIIITMSVLSAFVFIVVAVINIINYSNINARIDRAIDAIQENYGILPDLTPPHETIRFAPRPDNMIMQTRYFTVSFIDENISNVYLDRSVSIEEAEAKSIALSLYNSKKTSGFYSSYKYRFVTYNDIETDMFIFVDATIELNNFSSFLSTSIYTSIGGLMLLFIIIFVTSTIATRPISESYSKQKMFITNINHEIKTPLSIIKATNEIIEMNDGKNEWTEIIDGQINKLTNLTEKLIFLSKMDEDNIKCSHQEFNLSQTSYEVSEPFILLAESKNKKLEIRIEDNLKYVGDVSLIGQLISILLDNAIKYSSKEATITLEVFSQGKNIKIKTTNPVDNHKPGKLDYLFDRFYKEDNSSNGQGIGLSIAKTIIHAHKGKIQAYSENSNTITFNVTL